MLREDCELLGEVPRTHAQLVRVDLGVRNPMVQEDDGLPRDEVPCPPNRSAYFSRKEHF